MPTAHESERARIDVSVALAGCAALARAALLAASDGYARAGLTRLALESCAARFLAGFALALAVYLGLELWRARRGAAGPFAVALVFTWAFLALRWPSFPWAAPGWSGTRAIAGQSVALLVALCVALSLARAGRLRRAPARLAFRATWALVGAALVAHFVRAAAPAASAARPNVLVIAIDSLRADRVGVLGADQRTTPELDRFARRALSFERAFTPTPATLPAHATLLTGLEPATHGVSGESALQEAAPTLAESLRAAGFVTAAQFDDHPWIDRGFGLARGFDLCRRVPGSAPDKLAALEPLIEDLSRARFFLYAHFADPAADPRRSPYEAEVRDLNEFVGAAPGEFVLCDENGRCGARLLRARGIEGRPPNADERRRIAARYDAGVSGLDRALGELFLALERRGLLENTLVVVTASHGESLFEHGLGLHDELHAAATRIPLVIRPPGGTNARSLARVVSLSDVAPTVLELAGVVPPPAMQGRSLAELARGADDCPRGPFVIQCLDAAHWGVRTDRWSLLDTREGRRLYDARADPDESEPLEGPEFAGAREHLERVLQAARASGERLARSLGARPPPPVLGADSLRRLAFLGEIPGESLR